MTSFAVKRRHSEVTASPRDGMVDGPRGIFSKSDSEDYPWSSPGYNYLHPFVYKLNIESRIDLAKIYVLTVLLLPIRVVGSFLSLVSAWMFACIGLCGITNDELYHRPLQGWRKKLQRVVGATMRLMYASVSFHYITTKGERASAKKAPILVVAPHSSYVDSIIVVASEPPSIVAKHETSNIPLLGKIINFAQPIYVQRGDPDSRQNTIRSIVDRARSQDGWPQIVIFAEGTCTNRTALIKFKPGAFYAGVPVQPVLLKYPNKYDTFTWTWDGPDIFRLLWLTMAHFYNRCEIEYLPVYNPSDEEKSDANLYAKNVRQVMAKALGIPTSEYSFEDVIMMNRAKEMKIPFPGDIIEIERNLFHLGLLAAEHDINVVIDLNKRRDVDRVNIITFSERLRVNLKNIHLHNLFALLDHRRIGNVNMKSFLLCSFFCKYKNERPIDFLRAITNIYSDSSQKISRISLSKIVRHMSMSAAKSDAIFIACDKNHRGYISFDDFEEFIRDLPEYKHYYKKREQIRRDFRRQ